MGRPFRVYSMSLVERLGLGTISNLYSHMSNNDIVEWMAYDLTQDNGWREQYYKMKDIEEQKVQSLEDESERMRLLFSSLGGR